MKLKEAVKEALDILLESTKQEDATKVIVPTAVLHTLVTECIDLKMDDNEVIEVPEGEDYFPQRLAELIKLRGITSRELSDMCGITEVSMARYLKGDRQPKAVYLHNMAKVLGVTESYLLFGENNQRRK